MSQTSNTIWAGGNAIEVLIAIGSKQCAYGNAKKASMSEAQPRLTCNDYTYVSTTDNENLKCRNTSPKGAMKK